VEELWINDNLTWSLQDENYRYLLSSHSLNFVPPNFSGGYFVSFAFIFRFTCSTMSIPSISISDSRYINMSAISSATLEMNFWLLFSCSMSLSDSH